jgi:ArsR family transcriptional regulator
MAQSKAAAFERDTIELARFFKALAHPARVEIIKVLAQRGTCVCGEIVEELPLAQATVSQHLKALKSAGLIRGEIEGPSVCYCIDYDAVARGKVAVDTYLENVDLTC